MSSIPEKILSHEKFLRIKIPSALFGWAGRGRKAANGLTKPGMGREGDALEGQGRRKRPIVQMRAEINMAVSAR